MPIIPCSKELMGQAETLVRSVFKTKEVVNRNISHHNILCLLQSEVYCRISSVLEIMPELKYHAIIVECVKLENAVLKLILLNTHFLNKNLTKVCN